MDRHVMFQIREAVALRAKQMSVLHDRKRESRNMLTLDLGVDVVVDGVGARDACEGY
jgi:hypothetical protein